MNVAQHQTQDVRIKEKLSTFLLHAFLGSVFIAVCAHIRIPLEPVPMTLQTFAVMLLSLRLGGKKAAAACLVYLLEVGVGLPVSVGTLTGATAGFLLAFPVAAYVMGSIAKNKTTFAWRLMSISAGQFIIYAMGVSFLAGVVGFTRAVQVGVVPFLFVAGLKMMLVLGADRFFVKGR